MKIAFQRSAQIFVMNADGSGQANISNNAASDTNADWQPLSQIRFGKLKRNKKKGTATLTVEVPAPGILALSGKGVVKKRLAGTAGPRRARS